MPFDIDVPVGGSQGPFVQWQAKESTDGVIPGRSWTIRNADGREVFDAFKNGVVLDIDNMKTGWCYSTGTKGVAPEWQWNSSLSRFAPQPPDKPGDARWQRGFSIPLAFGPKPDDYAIWEQAQAGAWQSFVHLVGLLKAANFTRGTLPVVRQADVEKITSARGITFAPKFEIVKWVPRPPALQEEGVDTGGPPDAGLNDRVPF